MIYQRYVKRTIDSGLALIVLVLALPAGIIIAILIKIDSKGPCLFTQERTGVNGELFKMYKFRTMAATNDVRDTTKANQVTRMGSVARSLSLDEVPQMFNILRGEMSFIGPRPWIHEYYENMTPKQRTRVSVLPGVTGYAQAYGRNNLSIHGKLKYDLEYVHHITFTGDAKILFKTFEALFTRTGQEISKFSISQEIETLRMQLHHISDETVKLANTPIQPSYKTGSVFYSKIDTTHNSKSKAKSITKSKSKKVVTRG